MIFEMKDHSGEYQHTRYNKIIFIKKVVGRYALIEYEGKKEVVITKEFLFENFNKIDKDEESIKH